MNSHRQTIHVLALLGQIDGKSFEKFTLEALYTAIEG